ncbi:MAG: LTA synthase family protein [Clostridia bacterium]|nr:LTA synthase family protein [Clostridia bacterium]
MRFFSGVAEFFRGLSKFIWQKKWWLVSIAMLLIVPIPSYIMMEEFVYSAEGQNSDTIFYFNLLFSYILEAVILLVTWSPRAATSLTVLLSAVFGVAEYAVMCFRSSPIMPWDLLSFGTAISVAGDYKFEFTDKIVRLIIAFLLLFAATLLLCRAKIKPKLDIRLKIGARALCIMLCVPMLTGYAAKAQNEDFQDEAGYYPYLFTPTSVYKYNGFYFSFVSLLKYMNVEEPDGYDLEELKDVSKDILNGSDNTSDEKVEKPNIIVIMNESFSDLSVLCDIEKLGLPTDTMTYIDSLTENTVKGQAYVSVKGGNTPNSEWEFLTGNTMAFLPSGSIPYQQYIRSETDNLMSTLKNNGYKTYGIHPYGASGWKRDFVYPLLGIDESLFSSEFSSSDKIRNYISDEAIYDKVIRLYHENLKNDTPLAFFCVTMQNHGGYTNFAKYSYFDFLDAEMETVHQKLINKRAILGYSELVTISDRELGELIEFFRGEEEPTVILMFGDHQPNSSITKPILHIYGIEEESNDWNERSKQFIVPFVMWANYDIEEREGIVTSLNYLNIMLSEAAGFELTGYQTFRKELMEKYPVITANFCINDRGELLSWDELDMDKDKALILYKQLQYNHTFDTENTLENFFE